MILNLILMLVLLFICIAVYSYCNFPNILKLKAFLMVNLLTMDLGSLRY